MSLAGSTATSASAGVTPPSTASASRRPGCAGCADLARPASGRPARGELHLARLDLREIEHVVDELEQWRELLRMSPRYSFCSGRAARLPSCRISAKPMMALSGVRSSCDMLARNSLLRRLASFARALSSRSCRCSVTSFATPTSRTDFSAASRSTTPWFSSQRTCPSGRTRRFSKRRMPGHAARRLNRDADPGEVVLVHPRLNHLGGDFAPRPARIRACGRARRTIRRVPRVGPTPAPHPREVLRLGEPVLALPKCARRLLLRLLRVHARAAAVPDERHGDGERERGVQHHRERGVVDAHDRPDVHDGAERDGEQGGGGEHAAHHTRTGAVLRGGHPQQLVLGSRGDDPHRDRNQRAAAGDSDAQGRGAVGVVDAIDQREARQDARGARRNLGGHGIPWGFQEGERESGEEEAPRCAGISVGREPGAEQQDGDPPTPNAPLLAKPSERPATDTPSGEGDRHGPRPGRGREREGAGEEGQHGGEGANRHTCIMA